MLLQITMLLPLTMLMVLFPMLNNPLSMGVSLILMTILMAPAMGVSMSHLWISYMLVLILLGGLLVIFIYVSLLAPNESFKLSKKSLTSLLISLMFMMSFLIFKENVNMNSNQQTATYNNQEGWEWLISLYSMENAFTTIFLMLYLLLTLIVVVNNTKMSSLPLRSIT